MNSAWEEAQQLILSKNVVTDVFDKYQVWCRKFHMFFERSILYAKNFVFREAADFPIPPPL